MSKHVVNRILMGSIAVLSVAVIVLVVLIVREGRTVQIENLNDDLTQMTGYEENESEEDELETESEEATKKQYAMVITTRVNIRSTDSEDGMVYATVEEGDYFEFVEVLGTGWTHIIYDGKDAYINSKYVKLVNEDAVKSLEDAVKQDETQDTVESVEQ